jgi:hypothetical protein
MWLVFYYIRQCQGTLMALTKSVELVMGRGGAAGDEL